MRAHSRLGLVIAVGLVACAVLAAGAQADHGAVDINPDETEIVGTASNPTINYEGTVYQCNTGTFRGFTNVDSDIVNVALTFSGNCNTAGLGATVTCSTASDPNTTDNEWGEVGTARLHALNASANDGEIDRFNKGFFCDLTIAGVCIITFAAQDLPSNVDGTPGRVQADLVNEGAETPPTPVDDTIAALLDVDATRIGSSLCGPAHGDFGINADYVLDTNVSFDAP